MRMRVADIVSARLLQLKEAVVVAHDPIIADRALVFQTKTLPQLDRARRLAVIVFRCRRVGRVKRGCVPANTPAAEIDSPARAYRCF